MERVPDRPDEHPDHGEEYPAGTEGPTDLPGVDPAEGDDVQPGFQDEPPQAD